MKSEKKPKDNRRNFIKKGVAGMAGLTVFPSLKSASFLSDEFRATGENKG